MFGEKNGACVGELLVLRPNPNTLPSFLFYRLLSSGFIDLVDGSTYGTKMPRASWNDFIKHQLLAIPSLEEQERISKFLMSEIERIENLSIRLNKEIILLNEYKTSLISEAVTGKIDVRDYQFKSEHEIA